LDRVARRARFGDDVGHFMLQVVLACAELNPFKSVASSCMG
jgi:hypothetical protein